jgi:sulfotransferase
LVDFFPDLRVICCVRNPAWIVDSVERLTRRNKFEPSKIFNFDPSGTVYSRADGLSGGPGMLGFAFNACARPSTASIPIACFWCATRP